MKSSGGVAPAAEAARAGAWSVLSGPAGGAVGAGLLARLSGDGDAVGFDMGGTSCDVCVVEGGRGRAAPTRARSTGASIQLPMVDVHTVGAGGGSIGWRDHGGALRVGPQSAGADPGPACYGRGGRSRPSPTPTCCSATSTRARRWPAASTSTPRRPRRAVETLGSQLGLDEPRDRRGDRPRRQPGDGPRAARGHGRARHRPARLRADAVRRRRADARRRARRRARHEPDPLPARQRRPLGARPDRLRAPPRHGPHGDARGRRPDAPSGSPPRSPRSGNRSAPGLEDATRRGRPTSCATAGQAFELPVAGPPTPDPAELAERLRGASTSAATATATPTPRSSSSTSAWRWSCPGPRPSRGRRPSASARAQRSRRARFGGEWVEARGPARRAAGRRRGGGPVRLRAARGDPRPAAGLARASRRARHDRRGAVDERTGAMRRGSTRSRLQVLVGGAARRLRRDGRVADPLRLLGQHQGAPRLLDRALRRRRASW